MFSSKAYSGASKTVLRASVRPRLAAVVVGGLAVLAIAGPVVGGGGVPGVVVPEVHVGLLPGRSVEELSVGAARPQLVLVLVVEAEGGLAVPVAREVELVAHVVHHDVHDDVHAELVGPRREVAELLDRAQALVLWAICIICMCITHIIYIYIYIYNV